jgi:Cu/Ag efflux protein CusF
LTRLRAGAWIVALALAAIAIACGGDAASQSEGRGVVRGLSADRTSITLEHGDIPGLMSAMTMDFALADPALATDLAVGDEVEFRLRYAGGVYTVTELRRAPTP